MAWMDLKAAVAAVVKTNGTQAITGALLQLTLSSIIDQVGANATFKGVATPTTTPGTPDGPLFYIAYEKGIYANFNAINITEEDGLVIILYSSNWNKINIPLASKDELVQVRSDLSELEQEQIQGGVYDVSSHNDGAVFESISTLLGSANLSTLIPTLVRRGGMSIRFIHGSVSNSDNKYAQFRCIADGFTIDTTKWAIADEGVYVENPEFVYVKTDAEGKILWAIKKDGSIYYGAGVPQQIIDYIEEKLAGFSLDEYEDIVAFLNGLEEGDKTLQTLLNKKVDKEESKSLIDADYASTKSNIENPEFLEAKTDSEGKLLAGRTPDGAAFEKVGINTPKVSIDGHTIENIEDPEERSEIVTDKENKIVCYRKEDGTKVEKVGIETDEGVFNKIKVTDIIQVGLPRKTELEEIYLERPKFAEFRFYGKLPTDTSESRTPTELDFLYKVNGKTLLSAKCTLAIQGHGSMHFPKKNYTFEPMNANGDAVSIKWGDMISVDSFHLKGFYTDKPHVRGVGSAKVWRSMIKQLPFPYNKVNNIPLNISTNQKIDAFSIADAKYSEDGFPCAFYLNDAFYGLYTLKLKKNRMNYGMEKGNKGEIFIDSLGTGEAEAHSADLDRPFNYAGWDLKNPKLKNYEEGGEITDATVLANIERLFYFTNNLATEYENHADYIVLPNWICWYIFHELIGDADVYGNNLELCTWDGTHWLILPYDFDGTLGVGVVETGGNLHAVVDTSKSGYILSGIYATFRNCYEAEIKDMYTKLRNSKCIDIDSLYSIYKGIAEFIPRDVYNMDMKASPDTFFPDGFPTIEQLYYYLNSRIEYLDSVWMNQ